MVEAQAFNTDERNRPYGVIVQVKSAPEIQVYDSVAEYVPDSAFREWVPISTDHDAVPPGATVPTITLST